MEELIRLIRENFELEPFPELGPEAIFLRAKSGDEHMIAYIDSSGEVHLKLFREWEREDRK